MTEHNKYNNSKIYKIVSTSSDKIYIGSTCNTLPKRLYDHIKHYKHYTIDKTKPYTTSYEIIKLGDYSIKLIEQCNYSNKQQLHEREGHYIKLNGDICVNNRMAGRTTTEYYTDNKQVLSEKQKQHYTDNKQIILEKTKQYRNANKQVLAEKHKQYRVNNKQVLAEKHKQYRVNNKDTLAEQQKQYRNDNKEIIAEKAKQTIQCECGLILTKYHLSRHQQSKLHNTTIHNTNINMLYLNELTTL